MTTVAPDAGPRDDRLDRLIARVPSRHAQATIRWMRRPTSRWARIPAGVLLICGGLLSILPILGLWMLPLGLMLLAEDFPPIKRATDRGLDWIQRHRPHWFAAAPGNDSNASTAFSDSSLRSRRSR